MKIHPNKPAQSHIPASHGGKYGTKNPDVNVIDFSSNVNPLGCHPGVKRYLKKQLNLISEYPDPNSTNLRTNLAWFTSVPKKTDCCWKWGNRNNLQFLQNFSK